MRRVRELLDVRHSITCADKVQKATDSITKRVKSNLQCTRLVKAHLIRSYLTLSFLSHLRVSEKLLAVMYFRDLIFRLCLILYCIKYLTGDSRVEKVIVADGFCPKALSIYRSCPDGNASPIYPW